jgi:hypothetical protein
MYKNAIWNGQTIEVLLAFTCVALPSLSINEANGPVWCFHGIVGE